MTGKIIVLSLLTTFVILFLYFTNDNAVLESTTQNIDVVSKERNTTTGDHWLLLANGKKIYVEEFSIWALIQEEQNYTLIYDLMKDTGEYILRTIVPGDYKGQF